MGGNRRRRFPVSCHDKSLARLAWQILRGPACVGLWVPAALLAAAFRSNCFFINVSCADAKSIQEFATEWKQ